MKTLLLPAVLGLCFAGTATAQTAPRPAEVPAAIAQPQANVDLLDTLSERIGDGQAYRLTQKGGETIVCTLQGRTDTSLIVGQCHFRVVHQVIKASTHKEAFPWVSDQPEYTKLSDSAAIKMLEAKPAQFHGTDIMYGGFGPNSRGILNACQIYHVGNSIKIAEGKILRGHLLR